MSTINLLYKTDYPINDYIRVVIPTVGEILEDEDYILVDAEEQVDLTKKYGVMQAPTLVAVTDKQYRKYTNASDIRKYIESSK